MFNYGKLFFYHKKLLDQEALFKLFLIVYGGFLLVHIFEIGFSSWQVFAGLLGGMAVALVAHKSHGYAPSIFLIGHMLIEWYHHAKHGSEYDGYELAFHGVHAALDLVFLFIEARAHYGKYAYLLLGSVLTILGAMFFYFYVSGVSGHEHEHGPELLHIVVIGGMLGCVISHLFLVSKWKHVHVK